MKSQNGYFAIKEGQDWYPNIHNKGRFTRRDACANYLWEVHSEWAWRREGEDEGEWRERIKVAVDSLMMHEDFLDLVRFDDGTFGKIKDGLIK